MDKIIFCPIRNYFQALKIYKSFENKYSILEKVFSSHEKSFSPYTSYLCTLYQNIYNRGVLNLSKTLGSAASSSVDRTI